MNCNNCCYNNSKSKQCKTCRGYSNHEELYGADPKCKHEIKSQKGGGIRCVKCGGWFCY